jgi:predicted HAD superfamily Cof-like phosphohydrolase
MKKQISQVEEFHRVFRLPINTKLEKMQNDRKYLRDNILREEVDELIQAMLRNDTVETADGIIDCIYILIGTAHEAGIAHKLNDCFDEIHRSNMSKLDKNGNPVLRSDGKVLKSEFYFRPDLKRIIENDDIAETIYFKLIGAIFTIKRTLLRLLIKVRLKQK